MHQTWHVVLGSTSKTLRIHAQLEPGRTYEDYEDGEDIRFRGPRLTKRALLDTVLERDLDEVQGDSYGRVGSLDDIDPATLYLASDDDEEARNI